MIGYQPANPMLFREAFTHPGENIKTGEGQSFNYERLEFLGDAVLSLIVSEYLFRRIPDAREGELTELRAKIVSRKNLNGIGKRLKLKKFLTFSEHQLPGRNIYGNLMESLIGALYLDGGKEKAEEFIHRHILDKIDLEKLRHQISSFKNKLVIWGQKSKHKVTFVTREEAPNVNGPVFFTELFIDDELMGRGRERSKKKSEETAARNAYGVLSERGFFKRSGE